MLLITGPGRCGTSVVAAICKECGYDPGDGWAPELDAGHEFQPVRDLNARLIDALNSPARFPMPTKQDIKDAIQRIARSRMVIKDPRLCDPRIMPIWYDALEGDLQVLLLLRDFDLIRKSRASKEIVWEPYGGAEYAVARLIVWMMQVDVRFHMLYFPYFLEDPNQLRLALRFLGLKADNDAFDAAFKKIYNPDRVHFKEA